MKILFTVHQFFPEYASGTEVLTLSVTRELIARGHEVRVLTGFQSDQVLKDDERFDEYDYMGIHVYRFHHTYTPMGRQTSIIALDYDNFLAARHFRVALDDYAPDVVHFFHLIRLGTGLIEQSVQAGIPCFMTPTDFWTVCPTSQLMFSDGRLCNGPSVYAGNCIKHIAQDAKARLVRVVAESVPTAGVDLFARLTKKGFLPSYPMIDEVIAIASRLEINISRINQLNGIFVPNKFMQEILSRHGVSPGLMIESAFGVDVISSDLRETCSTPVGPLKVGFIGTLAPHKGSHVLIEAFNLLGRCHANLKIYGDTSELPAYFSELNRLRDMNEDPSSISFCGTFHNSKISEILAGLDVLVAPSLWYENTPLIVYSAQASRCPVLASNLPGMSSVITDEKNGLLFTAGDTESLSKQLVRLIADPELRVHLSNNSRPPRSTVSYVDQLLDVWSAPPSIS